MNITEIINAYDGIDRGHKLVEGQAENVWNDLKQEATRNPLDTFVQSCMTCEEQYKGNKWANEPNAKDSKGNWKKRQFTDSNGDKQYIVPNAWYVSKSVLIRALQAGVDINNKGKSELEKELAALKKASKTAREKLKGVLDTAIKLVSKMEEEESLDLSEAKAVLSGMHSHL